MALFNVSVYTRMSDKQFNELRQEIENVLQVTQDITAGVAQLKSEVASYQQIVVNLLNKVIGADDLAQLQQDATDLQSELATMHRIATDNTPSEGTPQPPVAPDATEPAPEPASEPVAEPSEDTPPVE